MFIKPIEEEELASSEFQNLITALQNTSIKIKTSTSSSRFLFATISYGDKRLVKSATFEVCGLVSMDVGPLRS